MWCYVSYLPANPAPTCCKVGRRGAMDGRDARVPAGREGMTSHQLYLSLGLPVTVTGSCPPSAASSLSKRWGGHGGASPFLFPWFRIHRGRRKQIPVWVGVVVGSQLRYSVSMAEICCGLAIGAEASADPVIEISPRSARRRRLEIRRFRFVSGDDAMGLPEEMKRKRPSLDLSVTLSSDSISTQVPVSTSAESGVSKRRPRYGMTSVRGRRRDMEDAVSVHPYFFRRDRQVEGRFHYFGVFDGHGCSHVAVSCKDRLHEMVAEELEGIGSASPPAAADWKGLMERSFRRMDEEVVGSYRSSGSPRRNANCRCELQMPKCDHVGSTAVVAVVGDDRIVVANCGDSRAVLCRKGVPVPLSVDHKPDRPDELQRIEAAGGRVIYWDGARVLGVLAMSRAIGDGYLKPFVTSDPEVTITERSEEDECLILASDGLWDVVTNEMACKIVRMCLRGSAPPPSGGGGEVGSDKACSDAAMLLTKLALARQSGDNVSVVVVDLRRRRDS